MKQEEINKIRRCSSLLPPPGDEVVKQLLDEIERLREEARCTEELEEYHRD